MCSSVELRQLSEYEYHTFFRGYVNDRMISPLIYNYNHEQVSMQYRYDRMRSDHTMVLGVIADKKPVGLLSIDDIDQAHRTCRLGIILQNESLKSKGIGTKAFGLGIRYAFERYGTEEINVDTRSDNMRMHRILIHFGFSLVETVKNAWGDGADRQIFRLLRCEYSDDQT